MLYKVNIGQTPGEKNQGNNFVLSDNHALQASHTYNSYKKMLIWIYLIILKVISKISTLYTCIHKSNENKIIQTDLSIDFMIWWWTMNDSSEMCLFICFFIYIYSCYSGLVGSRLTNRCPMNKILQQINYMLLLRMTISKQQSCIITL